MYCATTFLKKKIKEYAYLLVCIPYIDHLWQDGQEIENHLPLGRERHLMAGGWVEGRHYTYFVVPFEFCAILFLLSIYI